MVPVSMQEGEKIVGTDVQYVGAISTTIDSANPINAKIRLVNEAMINWLKKRGKQAKVLAFVYIANPESYSDILEWTRKTVAQKFEFQPLLQQMELRVLFQPPGTNDTKEFDLTFSGSDEPATASDARG